VVKNLRTGPAKIAALIALVAFVALGLSRISFDVDVFKILPPNLRQAEGLSIFLKHFARSDEMLVTVEAADAETAGKAVEQLAVAFQNRPDLVSQVTYRPRWETHPGELAELAAYLLLNAPPDKVQAAVERVAPDRTAQTLQETLERLAETVSPAEVMRLGYDPLRFSEALEGLEKAAAGAPGEFSSADGMFRVLYLDAAPKFKDYRDTIRWVNEVRAVAAQANTVPGATLGFTGEPVFLAEISQGMEADMKTSGVVALAIIAAIFWLCYRRLRPLAALVAMLLLTFVLSLAAAGLFLSDLTVMGVGFAAIMVGLSVDYGYLIYQQWAEHGGSARELRKRCLPNIFWAALTTAAAFFMLNASSLPGLSQLGNLVGFGVVIGALVMYFVYASLIARLEWRSGAPAGPASVFWSPLAMRVGAWLTGLLVLVLIGTLIAAGGPTIDETTRALRPRHSPANDALDRLSERLSDQNNLLWVLITGKDEAQVAERLHRMEASLRETGGPGSTYTSPEILWPDAENQKANLPVLQKLAGESERLKAAIEQAGFAEEAFALTEAVTREWRNWRQTPVWPSNVSSEWLLRRVASRGPDGCVALGLIRPAPDREEALANFREEGVFVVSWPQLGVELKKTVPREFVWLVGILVVVTLILLFVSFRRVGDVALIAGCLLVVFLALAGAMALLGMQWNFFNMAAILLLLGTGVDYPLHMTLALRGRIGDPREAQITMGKVVFLCALSAAVGFGSISWASNYGLASLGRTCALGLALDALVVVYLLPAAWRFFRRGSR
jgi:predicted RND superfamily exporter protein